MLKVKLLNHIKKSVLDLPSTEQLMKYEANYESRRTWIFAFTIISLIIYFIFPIIKPDVIGVNKWNEYIWDPLFVLFIFSMAPLIQLSITYKSKSLSSNTQINGTTSSTSLRNLQSSSSEQTFYLYHTTYCLYPTWTLLIIFTLYRCYHESCGILFGLFISLLSICSSFWLAFITIKVVKSMMSGDEMAKKISSKPFVTIMFFFSLFLIVTFLLTISIASHDISINNRALISTYNSRLEIVADTILSCKEKSKAVTNTSLVKFESGFASIKTDGTYRNNSLTRKSVVKDILELDSCAGAYLNNIEIKLIGRTDFKKYDTKKSQNYKSNFELSYARALRVSEWLKDTLDIIKKSKKIPTLDWVLIPASTENYQSNIKYSNSEDSLSVAIFIQPILLERRNQLHMIDYLYFMIYTITTTGYGDIVPDTGLSKFIVSIANIFEIFFIVILFNSIFFSSSKMSKYK